LKRKKPFVFDEPPVAKQGLELLKLQAAGHPKPLSKRVGVFGPLLLKGKSCGTEGNPKPLG
jgi:hypothetical protein